MTLDDAVRETNFEHPALTAFVRTWITSASVQELLNYISQIQTVNSRPFIYARECLNFRLAEDAAKTAAKLSQQTDKLILHTEQLTKLTTTQIEHSEKLTRQTDSLISESRQVRFLTWGLLIVTAGLLYVDWHREHRMETPVATIEGQIEPLLKELKRDFQKILGIKMPTDN